MSKDNTWKFYISILEELEKEGSISQQEKEYALSFLTTKEISIPTTNVA